MVIGHGAGYFSVRFLRRYAGLGPGLLYVFSFVLALVELAHLLICFYRLWSVA